MKIGYACICLGSDKAKQRTCTMKYVNDETLRDIIASNLASLEYILHYNADHHIMMYRLSSDIVPFGSSDINTLNWRELFCEDFARIGHLIQQYGMRVSMHPGQYTLLNALDPLIVERSIQDLRYHCDVMDLMGLDASHKMILHVGGVYGDKEASMKRFIQVYETLSVNIRNRLVIENDDRYYHIEDVLFIANQCGMPVVFDNLHHKLHAPQTECELYEWLYMANLTWKKEDGLQKIHYSEQEEGKRAGAHARRISIDPFLSFVQNLPFDLDIMLEVKDKNFSALKIHYLLDENDDTFYEEWRFYRYLFYLHSLAYYATYDYLFSRRKEIDRYAFYSMADEFMKDACQHENYRSLFQFLRMCWYDALCTRAQKQFDRTLSSFIEGSTTSSACIGILYRMAQREQLRDMADGLYLLQ